LAECDPLDPEEIIELIYRLEEEDLVFKVFGEVISIGVPKDPVLDQEIFEVSGQKMGCSGLEAVGKV
jgi:hypothetical protein